MSKTLKVVILVSLVASIAALGLAIRATVEISRQCAKQCDWGDKQCAEMCAKRHFCPAHPDGEE